MEGQLPSLESRAEQLREEKDSIIKCISIEHEMQSLLQPVESVVEYHTSA